MSYFKCAYHNCDNTSQDVSMFRFPVLDKDRLILWIRNSGNIFLDSLTLEELKRRYICSAHFPESSIHKGIRNRLVGPAVPIHYQCTENQQEAAPASESGDMETDVMSSPEFLKVKTPVKFYKRRTRTLSEEWNPSPSPVPSSIPEGPLMITPTRLSRKCLFEGPKKRLSRKCLFETSTDDTPRTKYLKDTASSLLKKNTAQRARIRRLQGKSQRPANQSGQFHNDVSKTLALMQTRDTNKKNKWTEEERNFCLSLFYKSPSAYYFLRRQGVVLAAPSTIRGWLSKLNYGPGICEDLFRQTSKRFANSSLKEKACVVSFDEMSIMANLEFSKKLEIIEGFEDLGGGRRTNKIAKNALVLVARGLYKNWKLPIAYFLSHTNVKSDNLRSILKLMINKLFDCGLLPKAVVCDQMSINQKIYKDLGATCRSPFFFVNSRKIFAFFDVPHLIKNVRNNFLTDKFMFDNEEISFKDVISTYEIDKMSNKSRSLTKITDRHLNPNSFQKMNVSLATQIFSNSVSAAIKTAKATGQLKSETALATATFIKIVNDMFDGLNSGRKFDKNPKKHALSKHAIEATRAITKGKSTFENLQKIIFKTNKAGVCKRTLSRPPCFDGVVQSCEAALQLYKEEITEKAITFVMTKKLNQDVIENLFAKFRQKGGSNRNPTAKILRTIFRSNFMNSLIKLPMNSNCQEESEKFLDIAIEQSSSVTQKYEGPASSWLSDGGEDDDVLPCCSTASSAADSTTALQHVAGPSNYEVTNTALSCTSNAEPVTLEQCSTAYFAGYLAKSCFDKFKNCGVCADTLIKNADLEDEKQMLILSKSYTNDNKSIKLKMPSDNFLTLINLSLDCFNCHFEAICHKGAVNSRLFNAIKKYLECEAKDLLNSICMEHIGFIINKMILVKIHFYCKSKKKSASAVAKLKILKNK